MGLSQNKRQPLFSSHSSIPQDFVDFYIYPQETPASTRAFSHRFQAARRRNPDSVHNHLTVHPAPRHSKQM